MPNERTILFADVCESTRITEVLGDREARRSIARLLDDLRRAAEENGGNVVKTIGDEVMCAFDSADHGLSAAVQMQRDVESRAPTGGIRWRVKIGVHSGNVIEEGGDMFGDVVNVASHVVSMAAAEQVLTTGDALARCNVEFPFRSIGEHRVRGKDLPVHICELLWRGDTRSLTIAVPKGVELASPDLEFNLGDVSVVLSGTESRPLSLGRGSECSIVVPSHSASRSHAKVVRRGGLHYLEDHSTNGTYLKPDSGDEVFVHRDEALLRGSGLISLGEPIGDRGPLVIEYRTLQAAASL